MVRGYARYSHVSYLTTFFVFLSSTHRHPSCAGLEIREQGNTQFMDEDTFSQVAKPIQFDRLFKSPLRGL
jgi:hypothetical protein